MHALTSKLCLCLYICCSSTHPPHPAWTQLSSSSSSSSFPCCSSFHRHSSLQPFLHTNSLSSSPTSPLLRVPALT